MDQTQQLAQLHAYTYEKLSHDHTGHDMAHIERVVKMARTLNEKLGGNSFVVQAAALLHDVVDEKLFTDIDQAKASVIAQMQALEVSQSDQDHIMEIISKMSFSHSLAGKQELSLEGQIVQDADWLDAIGAIGSSTIPRCHLEKNSIKRLTVIFQMKRSSTTFTRNCSRSRIC